LDDAREIYPAGLLVTKLQTEVGAAAAAIAVSALSGAHVQIVRRVCG